MTTPALVDLLHASKVPFARSRVATVGERPYATLTKPRLLKKRVDVVSERLCDDVLKRLGPSLQQYKGCTVLDCLPGAGLFSKKVHDFLQPKRHILVEPQWANYARYLSPLLEQPHSSYRLWDHYKLPEGLQSYIDRGFIPKDPEPNETFLQLYNATTHEFRLRRGFVRPLDYPVSALMSDARRRDDFLSRGPFRLLLWCPDEDKFFCLPRSAGGRNKMTLQVEAHSKIEEVAGLKRTVKKTSPSGQRENSLELESRDLTRQRMKDNNVAPIEGRDELIVEADEEAPEIPRDWHVELKELEAKFEDKPFGRATRSEGNPDVKRLRQLRGFSCMHNARYLTQREMASEQEAIDALELESKAPDIPAEHYENLVKSIDKRTEALVKAMQKGNINEKNAVQAMMDNHHALHMLPGPLLSWDQRSYEPMKVDPSEFSSNEPLALLDVQARPPDHLPLTNEQFMIWELMVSAIASNNGNPSLKILDTVWPGTYDALVSKMPEFYDIREGGRRNLHRVTPRCLTSKMIWRIVQEWSKWPFRPDKYDIISIYKSKTKEAQADSRRRHA